MDRADCDFPWPVEHIVLNYIHHKKDSRKNALIKPPEVSRDQSASIMDQLGQLRILAYKTFAVLMALKARTDRVLTCTAVVYGTPKTAAVMCSSLYWRCQF